MTLFLRTHRFLLDHDQSYAFLWEVMPPERQAGIFPWWQRIESMSSGDHNTLLELHRQRSRITARYFVHVQEREIEYSRIRPDWYDFTMNENALLSLHGDAHRRLQIFSDRHLEGQAILYGGIKPRASIDRKRVVSG